MIFWYIRSSLNSNLILLIHCLRALHCLSFASFKFQSDSINTSYLICQYCMWYPLNSNLILLIPRSYVCPLFHVIDFKFQSDSINTDQQFIFPEKFFHFKFQSDSINTWRIVMSSFILMSFKFQSDSINTNDLEDVTTKVDSPLNSNLILLILVEILHKVSPLTTLNSNLILLILSRNDLFHSPYAL